VLGRPLADWCGHSLTDPACCACCGLGGGGTSMRSRTSETSCVKQCLLVCCCCCCCCCCREGAYTCWNTASGARQNNWGSRIDHILVCGPAPQLLTANLLQAPATQQAVGQQQAPPPPTNGAAAGCTDRAAARPLAALGPAAAPAVGTSVAAAPPLLQFITQCDIAAEQQGSDHAPVWATFAIAHELLPSGHAPPAGAASRMFPGVLADC
jgi:hypothetical protein